MNNEKMSNPHLVYIKLAYAGYAVVLLAAIGKLVYRFNYVDLVVVVVGIVGGVLLGLRNKIVPKIRKKYLKKGGQNYG